jgi:hypothetical protein
MEFLLEVVVAGHVTAGVTSHSGKEHDTYEEEP